MSVLKWVCIGKNLGSVFKGVCMVILEFELFELHETQLGIFYFITITSIPNCL